MSNALAIATVTECLVNVLTDSLKDAQVNGAWVSATTPDKTTGLTTTGINVFLYQISPNAALRNADLPTRGPDGHFLNKPVAAVDLHYLLTFYGDYSTLEPERLLGAATARLHAYPRLPITLIQHVQNTITYLNSANLDTQSEWIRFTPIAFTLEELSKLWSFLLKIDYVLSTAYVASVVLLETDETVPPPALPVLSFDLLAAPMQTPVITAIAAAGNPSGPILAGSTIAITGHTFAAPDGGSTEVMLGNKPYPPLTLGPRQLTVALPPGLAAGPQSAQVVQPLLLGSPPVPHPGTGFASAAVSFTLTPTILAASYEPNAGSPPEPAVALTIDPVVQAGQRVILQAQNGQLFDGGTLAADSATVTVAVPGLAAGQQTVRVLVDNATSPAFAVTI